MNISLRHLLLCAALAVSPLAPFHAAEPPAPAFTVFMAGDSTMSDYALTPGQPQRGWGQLLPTYLKDGVSLENHAVGGRSCRSFISEGRWQHLMARLKAGDWVIIQFGHNDEKKEDPKRYADPLTDYKTFLIGFVNDVRGRGAHPILVTPVSRRTFEADGKTIRHSHGDYAVTVRKVAEQEKVPLLDLEARTSQEFEKLGPERAKAWFMWIPKGEFASITEDRKDDTHFTAYGACRVCDLAAEEMAKTAPDLAKWIKGGSMDPKNRWPLKSAPPAP